jgi:hypothetical protein
VRLVITPKPVALLVGDSVPVVARYYRNDVVDSGVAIAWRTVDAAMATVSATGMLRARQSGQTLAIANGGGLADTAIVLIVATPSSPPCCETQTEVR